MFVYLIGAGPGDPGLITCKAVEALGEADVVVYDYLSSDLLLKHARPDVELIYVGKIAGNHALTQDKINALLVQKAKEGKIVARLKGGDPYIFGRGGEEGRELYDAGVPFMVIPGISSTIAGPAYAGIPLTDRTAASSVTIITGHEDPNKEESVHNWDALAKSASTLVFVMGMKNIADISKNLIAAGKAPETPAAIIQWGTTSVQRSADGALEDLPKLAKEHGLSNPSVIVVGEVVALRDKLNWNEKRPLFGKNIVVTRAREQASDIVRMLQNLGANVIQFPSIEIKELTDYATLDEAILNIRKYHWLVFTSVNGVKYFRNRLDALGLDSRIFSNVKIATIGPITAKELSCMGLKSDFMPTSFVAESVAEGMATLGIEGQNILIVRATEAREVLPDELSKMGASVEIAPAYETFPAYERKDELMAYLEKDELDCITFASSSTVRHFMDAINPEMLKPLKRLKLASIGPITSQTIETFNYKPDIEPEEYTIPALIREMIKYYSPETDINSAQVKALMQMGSRKR